MAGNAARELLSNGTDDRVTVFDDGRIKVWSLNHLWVVESAERHTALGESVLLTVGRFLSDPDQPGKREIPGFVVPTDPSKGRTSAGAVGISNGSFVEFLHDGSIIVGNDVRDIKETFNGEREQLVKSKSGRGGSVMVTFSGTMTPRALRNFDHMIAISESTLPVPNRLQPGEYEITEGKIKRD
ncbi:hypothetical protein CA951_02570 [Rhodococcus sp. NCIMB 12038]|nr:hypothetical protein CA951_02570 [Rhodococcus sp. NCIMB 12038]